ncbi:NUDIX hydrolase [Jannaschia sp. R86511]|uniref:NUDIX hydrolase n=1 Tax=Jannaschia sp. R86511 TaxID=3093853 RepID=UPI0036D3FF06
MTDTPKHSVSVAGIVVDGDGRVLVIQRRDNGYWEPPGGVLELNESFEAGVAREVLEETGVQVEVERLTGAYKNMTRGIVALVFRCHLVGRTTDAVVTEEALATRWISVSDVDTLLTESYAIRVHDALGALPRHRTHDGRNLT